MKVSVSWDVGAGVELALGILGCPFLGDVFNFVMV